MSQTPHAVVFESRVAAEAAASVRNALMIEFSGDRVHVDSILDWYRRDDEGRPMPAEWRDILGTMRVPWAATKQPSTQTDESAGFASLDPVPHLPKSRPRGA